MNLTEDTKLIPLTLTQPAAAAIREVMEKKNLQGYSLRIYVSGGGCSGYQYALALDNKTRSEDLVTETDGVKLIVDEVSIMYLQGATVDYVEGLTSSGFKIINPNAVQTCGCGQSFNSSEEQTEEGCAGCS